MENFKTYGQFIVEAYSDEERKKLADKGFALSDGSFPIKDLKDLKNAIQAYGRAKDQARAAKFIVKRAKALGAEDLIPDTEDFQKSLGEGVKGYDVGPKLDDFDGMDFYNAQYEISDDKDYHDAADEDGWKSIFKIAKKYKSKLKKHGIKSDKDLENFAKWLSSGDHMKSESIVTEAKVKVTKKDIKDIEDSGNIDIAYKKAMALLKSLSESLITVAKQVPAKTIAIEEGKDIGEWNQGGLKGNKNVLVTTFVGPPAVEEFGLGRKCMQINVGMDYVALNPADIVELKDLLKSYKVK